MAFCSDQSKTKIYLWCKNLLDGDKKEIPKISRSKFAVSLKRFYSQRPHLIWDRVFKNGPSKNFYLVHSWILGHICTKKMLKKMMVLTTVGFEFAFLPSVRLQRPTNLSQVLFCNSENKSFTDYCNTKRYWKQDLSKNWKTVSLNRLNVCQDRIHAWSFGNCIFYVFHPTDEHFIA